MKKPPSAAAQVLSKLFVSSSQKKRANDAFDPTEECVASAAKKQKKAFRSKPSNITVVPMPEYVLTVPRGKRREKLKKADR